MPEFISAFEKENKKQGIYLFSDDFSYIENKKITISNFNIFPISEAYRTTGYIITLETAKKMLRFLIPLRYEADMFRIFHTCTGVKIFASVPHLVGTNDEGKKNSSIDAERTLLFEQRSKYKYELFQKDKKRRNIACFFWRIFLRKTEKIKKYHVI